MNSKKKYTVLYQSAPEKNIKIVLEWYFLRRVSWGQIWVSLDPSKSLNQSPIIADIKII